MKLSEQILDTLRRNFAMKFMAKHPLIIGNNCLSSYVYYYAKRQFNSPFVWAAMSPNDMMFLINNFWDMDFKDVEFSLVQETTDKFNRSYVKACINSKVEVHYIHYLKHIEGKGTKHNIVCDNILDIAREKYFVRLHRMYELGKIKPFFMFNVNSENIKSVECQTAIEKMGNRKDVHIIYERTEETDNNFVENPYSNLFAYNRYVKRKRQRNMLYSLLEYLNDQEK